MKKLILLMSALFTLYHAPADGKLNKKERKFATSYLESSMKTLFKDIRRLTPEQWNYQPANGGWSIAGACEHLLVAEQSTYMLITQKILTNGALKEAPGTLITDGQVIDFIRDRSPENRVKTAPRFEPKGTLTSPADFIEKFKAARQQHITFAKTSEADMKSYFFESPAGKISAYQWLLVAAAHSERHFAQMQEVMEDISYPK
ncbi:MAG: hypothetical protein Roseis2KO_54060 [Roseivirga sp.]